MDSRKLMGRYKQSQSTRRSNARQKLITQMEHDQQLDGDLDQDAVIEAKRRDSLRRRALALQAQIETRNADDSDKRKDNEEMHKEDNPEDNPEGLMVIPPNSNFGPQEMKPDTYEPESFSMQDESHFEPSLLEGNRSSVGAVDLEVYGNQNQGISVGALVFVVVLCLSVIAVLTVIIFRQKRQRDLRNKRKREIGIVS